MTYNDLTVVQVGFWNRELVIRDLQSIMTSLSTDVKPSQDNTYSLGDPSYRWKNAYVVNLYASLTSLD